MILAEACRWYAFEIESLDDAEEACEVALRWVYFRAVMLCLVWLALGLACIAWAVHSTDEQTAMIVFWGGLLIANGGILITHGRAAAPVVS